MLTWCSPLAQCTSVIFAFETNFCIQFEVANPILGSAVLADKTCHKPFVRANFKNVGAELNFISNAVQGSQNLGHFFKRIIFG